MRIKAADEIRIKNLQTHLIRATECNSFLGYRIKSIDHLIAIVDNILKELLELYSKEKHS